MSGTLTTWQLLLSPAHAGLVAEASGIDATDVAAVERVPTRHSASRELMHAALQLAIARRKLAPKWPDRAATLIADPAGAEMASTEAAARHKAARFSKMLSPGSAIVDLCSGIGADAVPLRESGLAVTAVDIDPTRAWMAGENARCPAIAADAASEALPPGPFHLDPARRTDDGAHRLWQIDHHQPGPSTWRRIIEQRRSGAIKLGPGLDIAAACRVLPPGTAHEIEIISEKGRLTQAVLWIGELARGYTGSRVATLLTDTSATSLRADHVAPDAPIDPPCGPLRRHLIEADPSVERAGLLVPACRKDGRMTGIHPGLGLLTSDAPPQGPLFTSFEILAHMPWIEKNVRAWLKEHGGGIVEVKTRGRAVDPDVLQKHLRGKGETAYTVFVFRMGRSVEAVIARRDRPRAV